MLNLCKFPESVRRLERQRQSLRWSEGCRPGCRRRHDALAHGELSEGIISATPVSGGGGCRSAALNRGERAGGRQGKGEKRGEGREKEAKVFVSAGGFSLPSSESTDVGTLLRAGPGAESVRQQHALSPLCPLWDLCQERGAAAEVRPRWPHDRVWVGWLLWNDLGCVFVWAKCSLMM